MSHCSLGSPETCLLLPWCELTARVSKLARRDVFCDLAHRIVLGRFPSATIARRSKRAAEPKKNKQDTKLGGLFTSDGKVHLYRVIAAFVLAAKSDVAHFFLGGRERESELFSGIVH